MPDIKEQLEITLITYNRIKNLRETFEQIFAKNSPIRDFKIKILDNCSTDGSSELIEEYVAKFPNITHVVHNRNIGGNGNISRAFELAQKKYIWILCDDDFYDWESWHEIVDAIDKDYDVIFTQKVENDIADIFYSGTFVPACIYKTENLTYTVMVNMLDNIRNMFPQLAILAKNINENKSFFIPTTSLINIGANLDGQTTYIRGLEEECVPESRRNMYWAVGYLNSVELISDRKKQLEIIDKLRHLHTSLYQFFITKLSINKIFYKNYFHNFYQMYAPLSLKQRLKLIAAFIVVNYKSLYTTKKFVEINGYEKWTKYFKHVNQAQHLKKLAKKLKHKKVLVYGAGIISDILFEDYDMSQFEIVGVSDRRFKDDPPKDYKGYKVISPKEIESEDFDVILFAVIQHRPIAANLKKTLKNKKMISLIKRKFYILT